MNNATLKIVIGTLISNSSSCIAFIIVFHVLNIFYATWLELHTSYMCVSIGTADESDTFIININAKDFYTKWHLATYTR